MKTEYGTFKVHSNSGVEPGVVPDQNPEVNQHRIYFLRGILLLL